MTPALAVAHLAVLAAVLAPKIGPLAPVDLLIAGAVPLLWRTLRSASLPAPVAWSAVAWVAVGSISATLSIATGVPELPHEVLFVVLRRAVVVAALFIGAAAATDDTHARGLRASLLLAALAAGLYGVGDRLFPVALGSGLDPAAAVRAFERGLYRWQANHFAGLFAIAVAIALPLALESERSPLRRAARLALPATVAGCLVSGSRLGIGALVLGALAVAVCRGWRATLAVMVTAVVVGLAVPSSLLQRAQHLVVAVTTPGARSALSDRAHNWHAAIEGAGAAPVLGIGPGARSLGFYDSELLLALEGGGVIGLVAFLVFIGTLWVGLRRADDPGIIGALIAMFALAFFSLSFHVARSAVPFAIVAGAALARGGSSSLPGVVAESADGDDPPADETTLERTTEAGTAS